MSSIRRLCANRAAWAVTLAGVWCWTWRHLVAEWGMSGNYEHGFAVPLLCVFLGWQKWRGRMDPQPMSLLLWTTVVGAWLLLLLGDLLRRYDPIWRATGGCLMLGATLLTVVWLYRTGGRPLLRRFAVPLVLAWLALPWPFRLETAVTLHLLRLLTGGTVAVLNASGIAALQQGNTIELANGTVGMETACSGVQSLQAATMVALFLGQLYRFGAVRAGGLLLAGWSLALAANFGRVIFLALMVHQHGDGAVARFHDMVGYTASIGTFLLIGLVAMVVSRNAPSFSAASSERIGNSGGREGFILLATFGCVPVLATAWVFLRVPDDARAASRSAGAHWTLRTAALAEGWHAKEWEAPEHEKASLQYSERRSARVTAPSGVTADLLHFYWEADRRIPTFAFTHTPEVCLPSTGWELIGSPQRVALNVPNASLPCVEYRFRRDGVDQIVWQALFARGRAATENLDPSAAPGSSDRLAMLWKAPPQQIDEELLLYLPLAGLTEPPAAAAEEMLQQVLVTTGASVN